MPEQTRTAALPLLDSISYSPAAIVSKTLLKKASGTVSLFAFDAGQELSEHTAPFEAIVHVLEGEVALTIGGEPVSVRSGDLLVMPANVAHALRAVAPTKMLLTMIKE